MARLRSPGACRGRPSWLLAQAGGSAGSRLVRSPVSRAAMGGPRRGSLRSPPGSSPTSWSGRLVSWRLGGSRAPPARSGCRMPGRARPVTWPSRTSPRSAPLGGSRGRLLPHRACSRRSSPSSHRAWMAIGAPPGTPRRSTWRAMRRPCWTWGGSPRPRTYRTGNRSTLRRTRRPRCCPVRTGTGPCRRSSRRPPSRGSPPPRSSGRSPRRPG